MAKRVQLRRGTTADHSTFVGALGEVTVDTEKKTLKVHDGATSGGIEVRTFAVSGDFYSQFVPLPYPQTTPPTGYLMMMGQAISQAAYPILYSLYGTNLPDLRGVFVRGWDNGRGLDSGRSILSYQDDAFQGHGFVVHQIDYTAANNGDQFAWATGGNNGGWGIPSGTNNAGQAHLGADTTRMYSTGQGTPRVSNETRPKSVAFNYIVKAG